MFYFLKGTVALMEPGLAVLDCGGVGYACKTTNYTLGGLQMGKPATLYTHLSVREDGVELYGFATREEKRLFLQLISVSGVGPKAALSILSTTPPSQLALSIITEDVKTLMMAPGIGKKSAQRIVLELRDKLAKEQGELPAASAGVTVSDDHLRIPEDKVAEASAALAVLGYSQPEIQQAIRGLDLESLSREEIIKAALKNRMQ
ncbi:MAG: Holliday junction branch migration protein RuvA [Candidatus Onthomonas sp.]|nr:Holliday junction branch migration protein RuvA [Candidatus Onthomonas sp.]